MDVMMIVNYTIDFKFYEKGKKTKCYYYSKRSLRMLDSSFSVAK